MRRFVSKPSPEYRAAVDAVRALLPFGDLPGRAYAEATAERALEWWQGQSERGRLRQSNGAPCVERLLGKRCRYASDEDHTCQPPGSDHPSLWLLDGKPTLYVTQPYSLSWESLGGIVDFCRARGLEASVSAASSWHFPGWTVAVVIATAEGWGRVYRRRDAEAAV